MKSLTEFQEGVTENKKNDDLLMNSLRYLKLSSDFAIFITPFEVSNMKHLYIYECNICLLKH